MRDSSIIYTSVQSVKWNLYAIILLNGIYFQYFAPFQYRCNFTDEKCFACGLRTAVDLFLQGKFSAAYQSNKLIIVLVIAAAVMAVDVLLYLYRREKAKRGLTA